MSYRCSISFKQIAGDDVYDFLLQFKKETIKHIPQIAENNAVFSPLFKTGPFKRNFVPTQELKDTTIEWAKLCIFRYRYFYNKSLQLLGIYSVDNSMTDMFDCTINFQNSCDQDYSYEYWQGIKLFEDIAYRWSNATDEAVKRWYKKEQGHPWDPKDSCELDYYRRTAAYDEIWSIFSNTLFDDDSVVHLSLFDLYDFEYISRFYDYVERCVKEKIENLYARCNKKRKGKRLI